MRVGKFIVSFGMLAALCATVGQTQEKQIVLTPVKYDRLKQEVVKHRGKVLLVDFWATFCAPCMKSFPTFIAMHKKYASRGFEVIAVSVDDPKQVESAQTFLMRNGSPFHHFLLNESPDYWSAKLKCASLPCYFVFDRQGRWVRFGGETGKNVDYDELEKLVVNLLTEK